MPMSGWRSKICSGSGLGGGGEHGGVGLGGGGVEDVGGGGGKSSL